MKVVMTIYGFIPANSSAKSPELLKKDKKIMFEHFLNVI